MHGPNHEIEANGGLWQTKFWDGAEPVTKVKPAARQRASKPEESNNVLKTVVATTVEPLERRLAAIEERLESLVAELAAKRVAKEYYTTEEVAEILRKAPYTVREWCRLGRVLGEKSHSGRGLDEEWRISHEELTRYQNEGLLPVKKCVAVGAPRRVK